MAAPTDPSQITSIRMMVSACGPYRANCSRQSRPCRAIHRQLGAHVVKDRIFGAEKSARLRIGNRATVLCFRAVTQDRRSETPLAEVYRASGPGDAETIRATAQ